MEVVLGYGMPIIVIVTRAAINMTIGTRKSRASIGHFCVERLSEKFIFQSSLFSILNFAVIAGLTITKRHNCINIVGLCV